MKKRTKEKIYIYMLTEADEKLPAISFRYRKEIRTI